MLRWWREILIAYICDCHRVEFIVACAAGEYIQLLCTCALRISCTSQHYLSPCTMWLCTCLAVRTPRARNYFLRTSLCRCDRFAFPFAAQTSCRSFPRIGGFTPSPRHRRSHHHRTVGTSRPRLGPAPAPAMGGWVSVRSTVCCLHAYQFLGCLTMATLLS